jgi:hypothetical protein
MTVLAHMPSPREGWQRVPSEGIFFDHSPALSLWIMAQAGLVDVRCILPMPDYGGQLGVPEVRLLWFRTEQVQPYLASLAALQAGHDAARAALRLVDPNETHDMMRGLFRRMFRCDTCTFPVLGDPYDSQHARSDTVVDGSVSCRDCGWKAWFATPVERGQHGDQWYHLRLKSFERLSTAARLAEYTSRRPAP